MQRSSYIFVNKVEIQLSLIRMLRPTIKSKTRRCSLISFVAHTTGDLYNPLYRTV